MKSFTARFGGLYEEKEGTIELQYSKIIKKAAERNLEIKRNSRTRVDDNQDLLETKHMSLTIISGNESTQDEDKNLEDLLLFKNIFNKIDELHDAKKTLSAKDKKRLTEVNEELAASNLLVNAIAKKVEKNKFDVNQFLTVLSHPNQKISLASSQYLFQYAWRLVDEKTNPSKFLDYFHPKALQIKNDHLHCWPRLFLKAVDNDTVFTQLWLAFNKHNKDTNDKKKLISNFYQHLLPNLDQNKSKPAAEKAIAKLALKLGTVPTGEIRALVMKYAINEVKECKTPDQLNKLNKIYPTLITNQALVGRRKDNAKNWVASIFKSSETFSTSHRNFIAACRDQIKVIEAQHLDSTQQFVLKNLKNQVLTVKNLEALGLSEAEIKKEATDYNASNRPWYRRQR